MNQVAETKFFEENKPLPQQRPLQPPYEGGINIQGHAKQLCVNKLGHTMVVPQDEDDAPVKFAELFKQHRLKTVSYCAVFWSFGMCVAFLGPTLLDLECRISSVFSAMSWIFFSQSLFTLVGSACGGFLVQKYGNNLVLLVSTIMLSVTLGLIPTCGILAWLSVVLAIMGFFMGTIDTVANISMIQLYGRNVAPFLQALHFFYGLGAFLSPMVAEPFLLKKDCSQMVLNSTRSRYRLNFSGNLSQHLEEFPETSQHHHSRIQYAFWILAVMQTPVIALLCVLVIRDLFGGNENPQQKPPQTLVEPNENIEMNSQGFHADPTATSKGWDDDEPHVTREQVFFITGFTAALLFLYDGLQAGYGGYLFSYAVKSIAGMSMNEAAYLNACFWGTFAFGRLVSIGLATKLAPSFMLICNIVGCLFAMTLMLSFRHNHKVLYLGTAIFGTFLSSVYPTAVSLAETYINVTSFITSILVAGAASGEMIIPVIIGHEFDAIGPASLLVSGVIMTIISCIIYGLLYAVAQTIVRQSSERSLFSRMKTLIRPSSKDTGEDSGLLKHHVKYYRRMRSDPSEPDALNLSSSENEVTSTIG